MSEAARHRNAVGFKDVEGGLSQAIGWLHDGEPSMAREPTYGSNILAEADDFLDHAGAVLVQMGLSYIEGYKSAPSNP
jgi:hypothetical protein